MRANRERVLINHELERELWIERKCGEPEHDLGTEIGRFLLEFGKI